MMYDRLPRVADDSCQFAYEHIKQLDCVPFLVSSSEVSSYKPVSDKYIVSDKGTDGLLSNHKGDPELGHEASCVANKSLETNTATIPSVIVLKSSWAAQNSNEITELENPKRPSSSHSLDVTVDKRARHEGERKVEQLLEIPAFNIIFGQHPSSHFHGEGDLYSPFSEYFYWKHVPIGPCHQADVPEFISCRQSGFGASSPLKNKASLSVDNEVNESSENKLLGTCVMPMPDLESVSTEAQSCKPTFDCYCRDPGSIHCVRSHIMEARESLERTLGHEKFMKLGFCDMGETVAQSWTMDEESLFQKVVLSNPASLGRNFWALLSLSFPTRSSKELVSYYFNVFMLRIRAEQNSSDPVNADSDNDEWQESSEEEGEDSAVESPIDRDDTDHERDLFEHGETDSEGEYEQCDTVCEDNDALHAVSDECRVYESDKKSFYGADDRDIHDDSCTSSEGQFNVMGFALQCNKVKHGHENLHAECGNDCTSAVADYDCTNGHYGRATEKVVEFSPTCYVIEEMLGKESWEEDAGDGRPSST